LYYTQPDRARVVQDKLTRLWHGRKIKSLRESIGLKRNGTEPGTVRDILRNVLGEKSYFKDDLISQIAVARNCDEDEAHDKYFVQGKARKALLHDKETGTWRF